LLPGTARPMRRMERISGRTDDMVILRGVNLFPTQIEEIVLTCNGLSPHFQLELTRPERMDELTVRVEAEPGAQNRDDAARALADEIKQRIGVSATIRVTDPGTLERSAGKLQRIHDLRGR